MKFAFEKLNQQKLVFMIFVILSACFSIFGCKNSSSSDPVAPVFSVTCSPVVSGILYATPTSANSGTQINVFAQPLAGTRLKSLSYNMGYGDIPITKVISNDTYAFTLPESNVTVKAEFDATPTTYKRVSIENNISNGFLVAVPNIATAGESIQLMINPEVGYYIKPGTLRYTQDGGSSVQIDQATCKFEMPNTDVTVSAEFTNLSKWSTVGNENFVEDIYDVSEPGKNFIFTTDPYGRPAVCVITGSTTLRIFRLEDSSWKQIGPGYYGYDALYGFEFAGNTPYVSAKRFVDNVCHVLFYTPEDSYTIVLNLQGVGNVGNSNYAVLASDGSNVYTSFYGSNSIKIGRANGLDFKEFVDLPFRDGDYTVQSIDIIGSGSFSDLSAFSMHVAGIKKSNNATFACMYKFISDSNNGLRDLGIVDGSGENLRSSWNQHYISTQRNTENSPVIKNPVVAYMLNKSKTLIIKKCDDPEKEPSDITWSEILRDVPVTTGNDYTITTNDSGDLFYYSRIPFGNEFNVFKAVDIPGGSGWDVVGESLGQVKHPVLHYPGITISPGGSPKALYFAGVSKAKRLIVKKYNP